MTLDASMRMIIFDDGRGQLGPMTDLRAAFEVRTGVYTTAARLALARPKTLGAYWVPERLRALVADRANAPVNVLPEEETLLLVNGRWATPDLSLDVGPETALVEEGSESVVVACLRRAHAQYFLETGALHERVTVRTTHGRVLYKFPWDVLGHLPQTIPYDIDLIRMPDALVPHELADVVGDHGVEIHPTARVYPGVVFDAEGGSIVINEHAVIRPQAILSGPCSIGRGATVCDRARIKANTVIGPVCKVGGEIGGTVFQGYGNKAHDGHLGDSWVGKWVNLGAGTTNSNLLNTYGEVTMRLDPDGPRHRTGLTFLGAVVGDHVKTAINTRLMTGTVLGTGAMIASTAPAPVTVRPFAWLTDSGELVYRLPKFLEAMQRMMARRNKVPRDTYLSVLSDLHEAAADRGARVK